MSLRKKIGQMPAWKAGLLALLTFGLIIIGVEEYFINKVFSVMNNMATNFEREFAEDDKDYEDSYKKDENDRGFNNLRWNIDSLQSTSFSLRTLHEETAEKHQKLVCLYSLMIKKLEKLKNFNYPKNTPNVAKGIEEEISRYKESIEEEMRLGTFAVSNCKEEKV